MSYVTNLGKSYLKKKTASWHLVFFFIGVLFTSGCAVTPQVATLDPKVPIKTSNIGSGKTVGIKVLDERPDKELGYRGVMSSGRISSPQNIAELVYQKFSEGLKGNGFSTMPYKDGMPVYLKVEIRQIKYHASAGLVSSTLKASSALKGICKNKEKIYERMYRGDYEEEWLVYPFAGTNERILNESLSRLFENVFLDKRLLECLKE